MGLSLQAVRGMNDILPTQTAAWQRVESLLQSVLQSYGYQEVRMPIVEKTQLFVRTIGEVTDIVEKEMYTFADHNEDLLSLRPEGTASCVRMGIEHGLLHNQLQRFWYMGPMFRHERPQKGRYRQFHQLGVEVFGMSEPSIDAEIILLSARFWEQLGIQNKVTLEINSLGTPEERLAYRDVLVQYFEKNAEQLDEDSQRRLISNPLRILDSKNPKMSALIAEAPNLLDHLGEASKQRFQTLCEMLTDAGVDYHVNARLVRGLDYYSHTVFEWITDHQGAQNTVCAGGRYDGLVEQLGGKASPAMGFALGMERLIALLPEDEQPNNIDFYVMALEADLQTDALLLAEDLRDVSPHLRVQVDCVGGNPKRQFKRADKSGAKFAVVLGQAEWEKGQIALKDLQKGTQETLEPDQLIQAITVLSR